MNYDETTGLTGRATDYWPTREGGALVAAIHATLESYVRHLDESGRWRLWRHQHCSYYGLDRDGDWRHAAAVLFEGEQGETALLRANHYRSLLSHIHVLITGSRPSYSARASNADYRSQAQTQLAENVLDYYLSTMRIEDRLKHVARLAIRHGEGWLYVGWDATDGDPVEILPPDESAMHEAMEGAESMEEVEEPEPKILYTGDIEPRVYAPWDIARDVTADGLDDCSWYVVHRRVNRWDLATKYPEHRESILNAPEHLECYLSADRIRRRQRNAGEMVATLELWHAQTDAMPDGRFALVCGDALLVDNALPFETLPFVPMIPETEESQPFGYTGTTDLLALQEARDGSVSTILSNLDAFGRQIIVSEKGNQVSARDLQGLTVLEYAGQEPPQPLKLIQAQNESQQFVDLLRTEMEQISGINSVARGEPQASLKSGSALALVHSMAIQYNADVQAAYAQLFERAGTMLLERLKTFASTPRMAEIVGRRQRAYLVEFSGADIGDVKRVVVELGSALMRTSAGRKELADKFFEVSLNTATPMTFDQYMEIMTTGRLDPITERPQSQRLNIVRENEMLLEGNPAISLITDNHAHHIQEHLALLDDPSVRADNLVTAVVLEHIQGHANWWTVADPVLLAATGQQPAPAPMMMAPPPDMGAGGAGGAGAPMPNPEGGQAAVNVPPVADMPNPPVGAEQAQMPVMPELPPGSDPSVAEAQRGAMQ